MAVRPSHLTALQLLSVQPPLRSRPPACHPAGTRQWRRGADLESSVANFVESEQLVVIDDGAVQSSFVQVRAGGAGKPI